MTNTKKMLSALLSVAVLAALIPVGASAAAATQTAATQSAATQTADAQAPPAEAVSPTEAQTPASCVSVNCSVFTDVPAQAFFADAVAWAVLNGVTQGTSATTFSPRTITNRAMAITFLWRLAGSPIPVIDTDGERHFTDVGDTTYFAQAAQWAFEQGITFGINGTITAPTTIFAPARPMTRAQFVSILWRLRNEPTITRPASFTDTPPTSFFADAADWAANRGITTGDTLSFNGGGPLTRGQAVTFLNRFDDDQPTDIDGFDYSARGDYEVGLRDFTVSGTLVQVYYPADPGDVAGRTPVTTVSSAEALGPAGSAFRNTIEAIAPALIQQLPVRYFPNAPISGDGPFNVVLSSHGFSGDPRYVADHLSHIASWGFVVAAPSHPSRNLQGVGSSFLGGPDLPNTSTSITELVETLDLLDQRNADPDDDLFGAVDTSTVAAEGHSAGAGSIRGLVASNRGGDVKTLIGHATSLADLSRDLPVLMVPGELDRVIPTAGIITAFEDRLNPPKQLVEIARAGHNPVLDICSRIRIQGGLAQFGGLLAEFSGLADDGCVDGYLLPGLSTALIRHLVVAQTRWAFGTDTVRDSLTEDYLRQQFRAAVGLVLTEMAD